MATTTVVSSGFLPGTSSGTRTPSSAIMAARRSRSTGVCVLISSAYKPITQYNQGSLPKPRNKPTATTTLVVGSAITYTSTSSFPFSRAQGSLMPHKSARPRQSFLSRIKPIKGFIAILLGFLIGNTIDTLIHETGHSLMALAFGYQLKSFQIGSGEDISSITLAGVDFILRENVMFGGGRIILSETDTSLAMVAIILAGPLFPLLLGGVLMTILWGSSKTWLPPIVFTCNWIFLGSAICNLLPSIPTADGTKLNSRTTQFMPDSLQYFWENLGCSACVVILGVAYTFFILSFNGSLVQTKPKTNEDDYAYLS
ncbi:MAG: hypothetical protein EON60_07835 [Alphaproteobacteria bacterium]|nr:MAG: hypothetical protein EON60_07835 [Alphaproteobacteria bacterium]